jgi:alpha-galactosidase
MSKIVIVGAGGVIFAQRFIRDILLDENLRGSDLCLMDIDAERLGNAVAYTEIVSTKLGVTPRLQATTNLREALAGAKYVITIFRAGTLEHQRIEQDIPRRYGVDQVVGDTLGPGGVFRGLRTLKPLFGVLDAMEECCPGALLLNYVNPMSLNTIALSRRARTVKVIGLCHSVQSTAHIVADYMGIPRDTISYLTAGVNHQAFMLKIELDGKDMYPRLREAMANPEIYRQDKVRFELMRHFGYFPTESSGHGSEYVPYIRKRRELVERFCKVEHPEKEGGVPGGAMSAGESGAALRVCAALQIRNERQISDLVSGKIEPDLTPSHEYGVHIISATETNQTISPNLNVINNGLIPSLPPECCVEVPCLVNGGGILPGRIENYPEQLAGLNRGMINVQLLAAAGALEHDRRKIFHAIAQDPLTAAVCSLDEIRQMTDELFAALRDEIEPEFF